MTLATAVLATLALPTAANTNELTGGEGNGRPSSRRSGSSQDELARERFLGHSPEAAPNRDAPADLGRLE